MKKIRTVFVVSVLMIYFDSFGQDQQVNKLKKMSLQDVYINAGSFAERNPNGTLANFKSLAPQSVLLNNNMTGFSESKSSSFTNNSMFSILVGFRFNNQKKTICKANPLFRIGLSYFSSTTLAGNLHMQERKPFDTLTSPQTGQTVYIDSVTTNNYGMYYSSNQLRLDGSIIFRTNPAARWSIYTGLGITIGSSFKSITDISYSSISSTETRDNNKTISSSFSQLDSHNFKSERLRNKNNFCGSINIPLGVDFRIGKEKEFWKRTHLFYELKPGINVTSIPEVTTITNASLQHGLGLRISWD